MAEVDHVDVLVFADFFVVDVFDEDGAGRGDLVEVGGFGSGLGRDEFDVETGFFFDFAEDSLDRVFVGFDVSAGRLARLGRGGASGGGWRRRLRRSLRR